MYEKIPGPILSNKNFLECIIYIFSEHIPKVEYEKCILLNTNEECEVDFPNDQSDEIQFEHLNKYVRQQLKRISQFEYIKWINGEMPFVELREMQIWRLHQFCQHIWKWNIPEPQHLANIFNLTIRKASYLINDFKAKFWKTYLYPLMIENTFTILEEQYDNKIDTITFKGIDGREIEVDNENYIYCMNMILSEPIIKKALTRIYKVEKMPGKIDIIMFVPEIVMEAFFVNPILELAKKLKSLYPKPEESDKA